METQPLAGDVEAMGGDEEVPEEHTLCSKPLRGRKHKFRNYCWTAIAIAMVTNICSGLAGAFIFYAWRQTGDLGSQCAALTSQYCTLTALRAAHINY